MLKLILYNIIKWEIKFLLNIIIIDLILIKC